MSTSLTTEVEDFSNTDGLFTSVTLEQIEEIGEINMLTEILPKGMVTCVYSAGGQGKSTLIGAMVNRALNNDSTLNALWFDYDNALYRNSNLAKTLISNHKNRFSWVKIPNKEAVVNMHTKLMSADLSSTVVVIDALQGMFNRTEQDVNKAKDVGLITDALRDYAGRGATVLVIHHSNKQNKEGYATFRGSAVIQDAVDNLFQLKKVDRADGKLIVSVDITTKFSFQVNDANTKLEYAVGLDLEYTTNSEENVTVKPPKNVTPELVVAALEVVADDTATSLLMAEQQLMNSMKIGKNKAKAVFQYLVSSDQVVKELVAERRAKYKMKDK